MDCSEAAMTAAEAVRDLDQHDLSCRRCREAVIHPGISHRCGAGQRLAHRLNEAKRNYARSGGLDRDRNEPSRAWVDLGEANDRSDERT